MKRAAALALALLLACSPPHIDRARWQQMPQSDKVLYVRQLLGGEQAKAAKGGTAPAHPLSAEEYVRRIDEAYARGETRDVDAIFTAMAVSAPAQRPPRPAPPAASRSGSPGTRAATAPDRAGWG